MKIAVGAAFFKFSTHRSLVTKILFAYWSHVNGYLACDRTPNVYCSLQFSKQNK